MMEHKMGDFIHPLFSSTVVVVITTFTIFSVGVRGGIFDNVTTLSFDEGFTPLFGDGNLIQYSNGKAVRLLLDRYSGSGFISSDSYHHGLFSATIRLPSDYSAGVVVAFYTSNTDVFSKNHDELDFEFLGNVAGRPWKMQTNVYGNGSTSRGREERYLLPFDPSVEAHRYSIFWSPSNIIFYVDDIPIREVRRNELMGRDYPSKPMSLYATIWDGSSWATSGGKFKANYKYSPFVSEFSNLILHGCPVDPIQQVPTLSSCAFTHQILSHLDFAVVTPEKRHVMMMFRKRHMTYSACYDTRRYPVPLPECEIVASERESFTETGDSKLVDRRRRRRRYRQRNKVGSTLVTTKSEAFM